MQGDTTPEVVDRLGLEVMSNDECWQLLDDAPVGRVAFVDAGDPMILPVTHSVWGRTVAFRTGSGAKLSLAQMSGVIALEVDDWDPETSEGWSVVARGVAEPVYDQDALAELTTDAAEPWLDSARTGTWVRVRVDEISGRRLIR